MIIPLIIYSLFILSYVAFVAIILWHLKEYVLPDDKRNLITKVFLGTIAIFIIISAALFFTVPWDQIFHV
ncbi:MAG: hypothetical protein HZC14_01200 [Candidatus Niyogibacteria bacterium]|nr:hypothetical protein [Candidatus Niyogibacteria bacterium]